MIQAAPIKEKTNEASGYSARPWTAYFRALNAGIEAVGGAGADELLDGGDRVDGLALFDGGRRV
jgi:hypothetical protein